MANEEPRQITFSLSLSRALFLSLSSKLVKLFAKQVVALCWVAVCFGVSSFIFFVRVRAFAAAHAPKNLKRLVAICGSSHGHGPSRNDVVRAVLA